MPLEKQSLAREFTASHCCEFSIVSDSERITYPYGKDEYEYNTQKQVVKQKRSIKKYGEREVSYTYSKAGLPERIIYPDGKVVTYGYTKNGKFSTMNYAGTEFASGTQYNAYGAVSSLTLGNGLINTRDYDKLIRCMELSHVKKVEGGTETGFSLTYEYDVCGNITKKTDSTKAGTETQEYDEIYAYDGRNRLKSSASASLGNHTWVYDDFNNIVSWTRTVGNTPKESSYTYAGLVNGNYAENTSAGNEEALTAAGNRQGPHAVTSIETGGKTTKYVYNANGDMLGSLTGEGIGRVYSYDSQNRMTGMTVSNGADTNRWSYSYDDGGERIIKNTIASGEGGKVVASTVYWFTGYEETYENVITTEGDILAPNGQRLASRVSYLSSADGTAIQKTEILPRSEINGEEGVVRQAVAASTGYLYQIKDLLGSTVRVYNEKGECVETLGYEPFGKLVMKNGERIDGKPGEGDSGLTGARRTYTGHMLETDDGLYYCHARWYDAGTGRFIQADSVLDGLNRYTYCGNNPVNFSDPTGTKKDGESGEKKSFGQKVKDVCKKVVGAVKNAVGKAKGAFSGKKGEAGSSQGSSMGGVKYDIDHPINQEDFDNRYGFSSPDGTQSCKTNSLINIYAADGGVTQEQLDSAVDQWKKDGSIYDDGSPHDLNEMSKTLANAIGRDDYYSLVYPSPDYNQLKFNSQKDFSESKYPAAIQTNSKPGHTHYTAAVKTIGASGATVVKTLDSLNPNRTGASDYTVTKLEPMQKIKI